MLVLRSQKRIGSNKGVGSSHLSTFVMRGPLKCCFFGDEKSGKPVKNLETLMTYQLMIGNYAYSSWSLRGWLLLHRFGLPHKTTLVDFGKASVAEQLPEAAPARTVPALITPEGALVWDSLAMAEELATLHPEAGFWPTDPKARAIARSLAAEMHSGFSYLRNECPMNVRKSYADYSPSEGVKADLARLEELWDFAFDNKKEEGPWLLGAYSAADAFYAPVAARVAGFGLPVSERAKSYVDAHLADGAFRRWRAIGVTSGPTLERYAQPYETQDWPGPKVLDAVAVDSGPALNEACPYSGKPVAHFLEMNGQVYGFCNAGCRDKTVADPEAWPAFMAMVEAHQG